MRFQNATHKATSPGGIGFTGLLAVAFIVLKLTGYIDWSWWWVLAPLWAPALLVLCIIGGVTGVLYYMDRREWL